jgi:DNA-binding LacI/PurR family transcriptional regulator
MVAKMKDVAKRAGVSLTTVSHVLNRTHIRSISSGTRQRVIDAAKKLNYQPNVHARRLALRRSNTVGLIISEISNPFFSDVIQSFEKAAASRELDILLFNTEYDPARIEAAVRKMVMEKVRGVAVMTSMFDEAYARELARNRMNVVLLNPGPAHPRLRRIQLNFATGVAQGVDHLLELGHRTFGIITGPLRSNSAVRTRDIYLQALERKGFRCFQPVESHYKLDGGASAVRTLLAQPPLPTAILCANDLIALGAISALQEAGFRVPEDVSVVGVDDVLFARLARPPLTTVAVPRENLGRLAFEILDDMQRTGQRPPENATIETHLVIRKSTAPPPA